MKKVTEVPCPRCGVLHDTMNYNFLKEEGYHEDGPVCWYSCPTCKGVFHSLEV